MLIMSKQNIINEERRAFLWMKRKTIYTKHRMLPSSVLQMLYNLRYGNLILLQLHFHNYKPNGTIS